MKSLFYILTLLLSSSLVWSQGLKIVDSNLHIESVVGSSSSTIIKVQNTSNHIIFLGIKKTEERIRSSQVATFCVNNDCNGNNIVQIHKIIKLYPGQIFSGFSATLETGLVPGSSFVKYLFFNTANISERVEAEINYTIKEKVKGGILYASEALELSDVFPNPVREKAVFNYTFVNPHKEAKIIIHNVLGSVIGEFVLSPYKSQLSIPVTSYNPGVYFYTLYIDNEGVATKKMVVRN